MTDASTRVIAVDWSGDKSRGKWKTWLAEARAEQILRLENGRTPDQLVAHLIGEGSKNPNIVVGLDFAFSMPAWFTGCHGAKNGPELWEVVAVEGETWLGSCPWPFWGKPGSKKPPGVDEYRITEKMPPGAKSTFQIGGAGSVGTGSLRGMPLLRNLRSAGWKIWPFDPPGFPLAIEIYPRLLMGAVRKSCKACRQLYLDERYPDLTCEIFACAASTEDAFDAAVSALVMAEHWRTLVELRGAADAIETVEGRIWNAPGPAWIAKKRCPYH